MKVHQMVLEWELTFEESGSRCYVPAQPKKKKKVSFLAFSQFGPRAGHFQDLNLSLVPQITFPIRSIQRASGMLTCLALPSETTLVRC